MATFISGIPPETRFDDNSERPLPAFAFSLALHAGLLGLFAFAVMEAPPIETPPMAIEVAMTFESPSPPAPSPAAVAEAMASLSRLVAPPTAPIEAPTPPSAAAPAASSEAPVLPSVDAPSPTPDRPSPSLPSASLPIPPKPPQTKPPAPRPPAPPTQKLAAASMDSVAVETPAPAQVAQPTDSTPATQTQPNAQSQAEPILLTQPDYRAPPVKPVYPRRAIELGLEGEVLVRAEIDESGDPLEPSVWLSSGHPLLDRAALEAVRRWRFKPAQRNGKAIGAVVQVPVSFRLK